MNGLNEAALDRLVDAVIAEIRRRFSFEVEASGRHVHLCRGHVEALFGPGARLTAIRDLSQPGQFVCAERVALMGPKGTLDGVAVLGPERGQTQVELSRTDALALGVGAPVRDSGDLEESGGVRLRTSRGEVALERGVIVAQRHLHMTSEDGVLLGLADGDRVAVRVAGSRPVVFEGVLVRVSPDYRSALHIDYDEANACGFSRGVRGVVVPKAEG